MVDVLPEAKVQRSRQEALGAALDEAEVDDINFDFDAVGAALDIFGDDIYNAEAIREENNRRRNEAIARIDANTNEEWKDAARQAIYDVAKDRDEFTVNRVWAVLESRGFGGTHDNRAMGGITTWASQAGHIENTYRTDQSNRKTRHSGYITVWRSLIREKA